METLSRVPCKQRLSTWTHARYSFTTVILTYLAGCIYRSSQKPRSTRKHTRTNKHYSDDGDFVLTAICSGRYWARWLRSQPGLSTSTRRLSWYSWLCSSAHSGCWVRPTVLPTGRQVPSRGRSLATLTCFGTTTNYTLRSWNWRRHMAMLCTYEWDPVDIWLCCRATKWYVRLLSTKGSTFLTDQTQATYRWWTTRTKEKVLHRLLCLPYDICNIIITVCTSIFASLLAIMKRYMYF